MKVIMIFGKWIRAAAVMSALIVLTSCSGQNSSETSIAADKFSEKLNETPGVVIDVRTQDEYRRRHLVIADYNSDLLNGDFEAGLDSLSKNKTYYLYCRTGNRSGQAAEMMKQKGFSRVYNVGGYQDLVNSGFESAE